MPFWKPTRNWCFHQMRMLSNSFVVVVVATLKYKAFFFFIKSKYKKILGNSLHQEIICTLILTFIFLIDRSDLRSSLCLQNLDDVSQWIGIVIPHTLSLQDGQYIGQSIVKLYFLHFRMTPYTAFVAMTYNLNQRSIKPWTQK